MTTRRKLFMHKTRLYLHEMEAPYILTYVAACQLIQRKSLLRPQ
jgi:hypothetical protein